MSPSLIPLVLALAWGLNWPIVKIVLGSIPPLTFRVLGLGGAALLLLVVSLLRGVSIKPARGDLWGIAIGGVLSVAVFNLSTAFAQLATSTSRATVLTYTMPLITALLARLFLGERLAVRHAWALAVGGAGIALLAWPVWRGLASGLGLGSWPGLLLPLLAATGWAGGTVAAKRWPTRGDRWVNTAWQLAIGGLAGGLGAWWLGERMPAEVPAVVWAGLAFHIVAATALAYALWFELLDHSSATVAALTTLAVPVIGVLGAMVLVGDRPGVLDGCGFALVLAGAALAALQPRRRVG